MTKNSKSSATIRRRKNKPLAELITRVRKNKPLGTLDSCDQGDKTEDAFLHKQVLGSSVIAKIMSSDKTIFWGLVVIRLVNALMIQTFFVPDEYWQSMEVAHNMVFNYGYLTWEWKTGIRSYAYPLVLATLYKVLALLGLDYRSLLIRGPRLLQGVLASVGDMYLYRLSARLAGRQVAQWTLLCQLLSWFTAYCCTRTLSNSVETTLVTAALFYFPWPGTQSGGDTRRFVALAAMSVVVRPTAAVLWILLVAWHLQRCKGPALWSIFRLYLTTGLGVLGVATVMDRVWYGRWVLVHLNFLHFNVVSGGSGFYGRQPWHWYLTQGVPVVLGPHLLPFILGAWRARHKVLLMLFLWHVFIFSLLAHKEFRFLLPVLPLAMHYCGLYFHATAQSLPPPTSPPPSSQGAGGEGEPGEQGCGGGEGEEGETKKAEQSPEEKTGEENGFASDACKGPEAGVAQVEGGSRSDRAVRGMTGGTHDAGGETSLHHRRPGSSGKESNSSGEQSPESDEAEREAPPVHRGEGERAEPPSHWQDGGGGAELAAKGDQQQPQQHQEDGASSSSLRRRARRVRCLVLLLALTNLPPLLYFSLIHQRGTLDVMNFLHHTVQDSAAGGGGGIGGRGKVGKVPQGSVDVLFLMPCHSTPYYSHLHANVSLTFLTCEPNLQQRPNYTDEADQFYQDPAGWLQRRYHGGEGSSPSTPPSPPSPSPPPPRLPTHLVYFSPLKSNISQFLHRGGYSQCAQFFHTHFPEGRVGSQVLVSCR